jgi:hypothetical protein
VRTNELQCCARENHWRQADFECVLGSELAYRQEHERNYLQLPNVILGPRHHFSFAELKDGIQLRPALVP